MNVPSTDTVPLPEEQEVIERLKVGDRAAAGTLYRWYGDRIYRQVILPRLPVRELAEDVLKDTFRLVLERIEQFKPQQRSIFFWIRRIAINRSIDVYRSYQRTRRMEERIVAADAVDRTMSQAPPRPDRKPEIEETKDMVRRSLDKLNPRYAMALKLRLIEDRDREECAEIMNVSLGNFDVILHRASKAFRKVYPP
ncbi:MAG: sigma-70 family RNA polymerase sigma factor [Myxococcota bacterium]|nr:sigma-70 family RNA polymerase sigma factor [Myxococcota bacterium]